MPTIQEKQDRLIDDFNELGDSFDQYSYLVTISGSLPEMPETEKTPERLVAGCQSQVWLAMRAQGGRFYLEADSGTLIIRGVLKLLEELLNGETLADVAAAEITFLRKTAIMETFESSRQKGMGYILKRIRGFAAAALERGVDCCA